MTNERLGLLVGAVAALVLAFVVLSPGGDDDGAATTAPPATTTPPATTPEPGAQAQDEPTREPRAPAATVRVRDGKPVGGVRTITVRSGERVRIEVSSQDTSDEVHLHGYDIRRDLEAGDSVRLSFDAEAEGIFELELERSHTQIAKLVVEP